MKNKKFKPDKATLLYRLLRVANLPGSSRVTARGLTREQVLELTAKIEYLQQKVSKIQEEGAEECPQK